MYLVGCAKCVLYLLYVVVTVVAEAAFGDGRLTRAGGCARARTGRSCSTPRGGCATTGPWSSLSPSFTTSGS